jgi:hypothetical protein
VDYGKGFDKVGPGRQLGPRPENAADVYAGVLLSGVTINCVLSKGHAEKLMAEVQSLIAPHCLVTSTPIGYADADGEWTGPIKWQISWAELE